MMQKNLMAAATLPHMGTEKSPATQRAVRGRMSVRVNESFRVMVSQRDNIDINHAAGDGSLNASHGVSGTCRATPSSSRKIQTWNMSLIPPLSATGQSRSLKS